MSQYPSSWHDGPPSQPSAPYAPTQNLPVHQPLPMAAPAPYAPVHYAAYPVMGPLGQPRSSLVVWLLGIVTAGIYYLYWFYVTHDEMKRHSGAGMGGGLALVLSIFGLGIVLFFTMPSEIEKLYRARGWDAPVSAVTGLWLLLPIVGGLVWTIQVNDALTEYWRALGAQG